MSSTPTKPLLLYLPGLDGTGCLFYRQAAALRDAFDVVPLGLNDGNHYQVSAAKDYQVQPLMASPRQETSWSELVAAVAAHLDPQRPVVLCGESFGGCLALAVAAEYWPQLAGLVLVNPASPLGRQPWLGWLISLLRWMPESIYVPSGRYALNWLAVAARIAPGDRQQFLAAVAMTPQPITLQRLLLLRQFSLATIPLEAMTLPTLLLGSRGDRILPSVAEVTHLAQRLPQATVEILPSSGHACLLETDLNLATLFRKHQFLQHLSLPLQTGIAPG